MKGNNDRLNPIPGYLLLPSYNKLMKKWSSGVFPPPPAMNRVKEPVIGKKSKYKFLTCRNSSFLTMVFCDSGFIDFQGHFFLAGMEWTI